MNQLKNLRKLQIAFQTLVPREKIRSWHMWLERVGVGSALWCLPQLLFQLLQTLCLAILGEKAPFTEVVSKIRYWFDLPCRYGRFINRKRLNALEQLIGVGHSESDLRLLVANNILRRDGHIRISWHRERVARVLGYSFLALCGTALSLFSTLIALGAAPWVMKIALMLCLMILLSAFAYSMACFSILPNKAIKKFRPTLI